MRQFVVIICLMWLLTSVGCTFWYSGWQFISPMLILCTYKVLLPGTYLLLTNPLLKTKQGPLLIHFFISDCPYSTFKLAYFKNIAAKFNGIIYVAFVQVGNKMLHIPHSIQKHAGVPIFLSADFKITHLTGFCINPQAVLLTASNLLYYRGNYYNSPYCIGIGGRYVKMVFDFLLAIKQPPAFNRMCLTPYGCAVPFANNTLISTH